MDCMYLVFEEKSRTLFSAFRGALCVKHGSRFLVGTFLCLTLKNEEVQNAVLISFFFFLP